MSQGNAEPADPRPYCVVYSMGRVGSSSLHQDLTRLGFQARHAHFLTDEAFRRKVGDLLQPSLSAFEIHHWTGQLVGNLETRRRVEAHRLSRAGPPPVLLTLVRDPATWFCSNLVQNWEGISGLLRRWEKDADASEQRLVTRLFSRVETVLGYIDTIDTASVPALRDGAKALSEPIDRLLYNAVVAPFVWMEEEYCTFTGLRLDDLADMGPEGKTFETDYGLSVVGRVEEAGPFRTTVARILDCEMLTDASRANVSDEAAVYDEVMARFAGVPQLLKTHEALKDTRYRKVFGY